MLPSEVKQHALELLKGARAGKYLHPGDYFDENDLDYEDFVLLCDEDPEIRQIFTKARHAIGRGIWRSSMKSHSKLQENSVRFFMNDYNDWCLGVQKEEFAIRRAAEHAEASESLRAFAQSLALAKKQI